MEPFTSRRTQISSDSSLTTGAITTCPDNHRCFHGAECLEHHQGKLYTCDCLTIAEFTVYDGINCEYPATSYCNAKGEVDPYNFCSNGGICRKQLETNLPFDDQMCDCPENYAGRHCQFLIHHTMPAGLTPRSQEDTPQVAVPPPASNRNDPQSIALYTVGFLALAGVAVGAVVGVVRRRRRRRYRSGGVPGHVNLHDMRTYSDLDLPRFVS